jgi:hypothetical protein
VGPGEPTVPLPSWGVGEPWSLWGGAWYAPASAWPCGSTPNTTFGCGAPWLGSTPPPPGPFSRWGKGLVSLSIPLDLKNRPSASFEALSVRCTATVGSPCLPRAHSHRRQKTTTLTRSSGVGVPSLARGLLAPSARGGGIPVSVAHCFCKPPIEDME